MNSLPSSGLLKSLILWISVGLAVNANAQTQVTNSDVYSGKADITASQWVKLTPGFRAVEGSDVKIYISSAAASFTDISYNPATGGTVANGSPNASMNYIRTYTLRDPVTDTTNITATPRIEKIAYFDGLGRPVQTITVQGSPSKDDVVEALAYDRFGRDSIHYLHYPKPGNSGAFVPDAKTGAVNYYKSNITGHDTTSFSWNRTLYEASPLNRVTGATGPGAWKEKPVSVGYLTNSSAVEHYDALRDTTSFAASQLYITETTDEDGNRSREFKDKLGQVVRRESFDGTTCLRTAYVYDDFGQLVIVVPPKAADANATELCYYYSYDNKRRLTMKDLPGAEPVYLVYDKRDRLVLSQDGVQRSNNQNKWSFVKYDGFNRPVLTGEMTIADSRDNIADQFEADTGTLYESSGSVLYGYNRQSFPDIYDGTLTESNVYTVTYYDNYDFRPSGYAYQTNLAGGLAAESSKTKGLVTGSRVRALPGGETLVNPMAWTVSYYDDFGREVQTISDNHFETTSKEVVHTKYNFSGQPEKTVTEHRKGNSAALQTVTTTYAYDHQGRLLTEKLKLNSENEITLASVTYNELGEAVTRYQHGDASGNKFNQKTDYSFNVKGWLRTINTPANLGRDLFALDLRYNSLQTGNALGGTARYNGNISQMFWDTGTPAGYAFKYDSLNRIKSAKYADGTSYSLNANLFNTSYTYDKNGNFITHNRFLNGTRVDSLYYTYQSSGNRLQSVTDRSLNYQGYNAVSGNYAYDSNGNMIYDVSKGFNITYNQLNLPQQISCVNDYALYTWDAVGNKLAKKVYGNTAATTRYDYSGNFLYENSVLKCIFTSEGRIVPFNNNGSVLWNYEYNLKDHLGNTRVVFTAHSDGKPETNQITSYDPFGFVTTQTNWYPTGAFKNKFLYNGKELQDDQLAGVKVDWYDYGARFYDPQIGRWMVVDPLAEKWRRISPYNYCVDNPMRFIDPDGMEINDPNDYFDINTGQKIGTDKDLINNDIRLISKEDWVKKNGANLNATVEGSISLNEFKGYPYQSFDKSKILKEIGNYYYREAGYNKAELENNSILLKDLIGAAETNDGNSNKLLEIAINPRKFGSILNNKFDIINLFRHERGFHGARFLRGEKWENTPKQLQIWESEAYKGQMADPSWLKTSQKFQMYIEEVSKMYLK